MMESDDNVESSYCALQVAFQTMKERCQQLQARLTTVEEENAYLRQQVKAKSSLMTESIDEGDKNNFIQSQQEKIEELKKQKSQLAHHIFMVSSENRQLWKRLTRLTRANKSLGSQLTKISDTLKQHPKTEVPTDLTYSFKEIPDFLKDNKSRQAISSDSKEKEHSLEEISLRLINSIMVEKSELEQQYAEIVELQTNTEKNLKNIGFTYPEDISTDSLEQLKYHDERLTQIKEILLNQQNKLVNTLQNFKKMKTGKTCNSCKNSIKKLTCQAGTQFDSVSSLKENEETQTSLPNLNTESDKNASTSEDDYICPLCGIVYEKKLIPFDEFHEHVVDHVTD